MDNKKQPLIAATKNYSKRYSYQKAEAMILPTTFVITT
jgi:hypothetical protein